MRVKHEKLTHEIFAELLRLGLYRSGSSQAHDYFGYWASSLDVQTHPIKLVTMRNGNEIIGWGLIMTYYYGTTAIWTFISDKHRRKGYGTRLVNELRKGWKDDLAAWQATELTRGFYQSFEQKFNYL